MHSEFVDVFPEVEDFTYGAYCSASEHNEIDTPYHAHNKGQFVYAEKGTLRINFEKGGQYFLPVSHFIWIPKNLRHRLWTNNSRIMMFTIYFDNQYEFAEYYSKPGVYILDDLLYEMLDFARKRWNGHVGEENFLGYQFMQTFKSLLPELSQTKSLPFLGVTEAQDSRLQEILNYIQLHMDQKLDLSSIANRFNLSLRTLNRLFNAERFNFSTYLQSVRIVKAMELLAEKDTTINLVANRVGYESPSAFSNVFLRFTGMRPSDYLHMEHKS